MNNGRIFKSSELRQIAVHDNEEPLVDLGEQQSNILCIPRRERILIRKSVGEKLHRVQGVLLRLNPSWQLVVVEGYRSPAVQEEDYLRFFYKLCHADPLLERDELIERVHRWVALPSVAGHPTGGAVDVALASDGHCMDMGGAMMDFKNELLLPTFSNALKPDEQRWRLLLHDLMMAEGFAPYYGEWWHFSYGDREWAAFYSHGTSLYSHLDVRL